MLHVILQIEILTNVNIKCILYLANYLSFKNDKDNNEYYGNDHEIQNHTIKVIASGILTWSTR